MANYSRRFVLAGSASGLATALGASHLSYAKGPMERPLLIVLLRGAMDGLGAVPNYTDKYINDYRKELLPPPPGAKNGALALKYGFAFHPVLKNLHIMFNNGEASVLHASAMPSGTRSHFEAQDFLETALNTSRDGWLNRALEFTEPNVEAVAIGQSLPLILRGANKASSWAPAMLPSASDDTLNRLMELYGSDNLLANALSKSIALEDELGENMMKGRRRNKQGNIVPSFRVAANLLRKTSGAVTLSIGGWDTHARQGAEKGGLSKRLQGLDTALATFKADMGQAWKNTTVLVMTEFGRTVRMNGTKGTDHGTGGVAFLLGGAVRGGKILGDWPGLALGALFENRDLPIANDLRGLIKGVLHNHWHIELADIHKTILPHSQAVPLFW